MSFGLTNTSAMAQRFMNDTLREYLDLFCVVYIDDILIYSNNKKEHREQVRKVLAELKEAGLYVKPEKCEFSVEKTVGTYASTTPFFSLSLFHGSYLLPAIFLLAYRRLKCSYFYRLSCHFSSYFINLFYYLTWIHF